MILLAIAFSAVALDALGGIAIWLGIIDLMVTTFAWSCRPPSSSTSSWALPSPGWSTRDWAQNRWQELALLVGGAFVVVLVTSLPGHRRHRQAGGHRPRPRRHGRGVGEWWQRRNRRRAGGHRRTAAAPRRCGGRRRRRESAARDRPRRRRRRRPQASGPERRASAARAADRAPPDSSGPERTDVERHPGPARRPPPRTCSRWGFASRTSSASCAKRPRPCPSTTCRSRPSRAPSWRSSSS